MVCGRRTGSVGLPAVRREHGAPGHHGCSYLRTLCLRRDRFAVWHSNLAGGFIARPDFTITDIVAEKSRKQYRQADELWLAIQCSTRISEMVSDILGVEDFDAVPSLEAYLFSSTCVPAH
jgi:hypothetical protein